MLTLFFLLTHLTWAETLEAPSGLDYRLDADVSYFSSSSNFIAGGGGAETLPNSGSFTDIQTALKYTQDLDVEQRVYGGLNIASVESWDGNTTRSNSGLNEILAGWQYWIGWSSFHLVPHADLVYPLFRVDRGGDEALLGEGALKVRGGGTVLTKFGTWRPFIYLGYEYRDEGRSHAVPYALGAKWKGRKFWFEPQYRGFERLFANEDTENRGARDGFLEKVDGGSYRFYSINPSLSEFALEAGYLFGAITARAGVAYTVAGSSSAQGFTILGGLTYTPRGHTQKIEDPDRYYVEPEKNDRFSPTPEEFDEFDPTKPPKAQSESAPRAKKVVPPKPQPSSAQPKVELRPAPKKASKPARPKKNKVDKMLDETEKGLQGL